MASRRRARSVHLDVDGFRPLCVADGSKWRPESKQINPLALRQESDEQVVMSPTVPQVTSTPAVGSNLTPLFNHLSAVRSSGSGMRGSGRSCGSRDSTLTDSVRSAWEKNKSPFCVYEDTRSMDALVCSLVPPLKIKTMQDVFINYVTGCPQMRHSVIILGSNGDPNGENKDVERAFDNPPMVMDNFYHEDYNEHSIVQCFVGENVVIWERTSTISKAAIDDRFAIERKIVYENVSKGELVDEEEGTENPGMLSLSYHAKTKKGMEFLVKEDTIVFAFNDKTDDEWMPTSDDSLDYIERRAIRSLLAEPTGPEAESDIKFNERIVMGKNHLEVNTRVTVPMIDFDGQFMWENHLTKCTNKKHYLSDDVHKNGYLNVLESSTEQVELDETSYLNSPIHIPSPSPPKRVRSRSRSPIPRRLSLLKSAIKRGRSPRKSNSSVRFKDSSRSRSAHRSGSSVEKYSGSRTKYPSPIPKHLRNTPPNFLLDSTSPPRSHSDSPRSSALGPSQMLGTRESELILSPTSNVISRREREASGSRSRSRSKSIRSRKRGGSDKVEETETTRDNSEGLKTKVVLYVEKEEMVDDGEKSQNSKKKVKRIHSMSNCNPPMENNEKRRSLHGHEPQCAMFTIENVLCNCGLIEASEHKKPRLEDVSKEMPHINKKSSHSSKSRSKTRSKSAPSRKSRNNSRSVPSSSKSTKKSTPTSIKQKSAARQNSEVSVSPKKMASGGQLTMTAVDSITASSINNRRSLSTKTAKSPSSKSRNSRSKAVLPSPKTARLTTPKTTSKTSSKTSSFSSSKPKSPNSSKKSQSSKNHSTPKSQFIPLIKSATKPRTSSRSRDSKSKNSGLKKLPTEEASPVVQNENQKRWERIRHSIWEKNQKNETTATTNNQHETTDCTSNSETISKSGRVPLNRTLVSDVYLHLGEKNASSSPPISNPPTTTPVCVKSIRMIASINDEDYELIANYNIVHSGSQEPSMHPLTIEVDGQLYYEAIEERTDNTDDSITFEKIPSPTRK